MKNAFLTLATILFHLAAAGQTGQTLTLDECQRLARENHPAIERYGLIEKSARYTIANAKTNWLPQPTFTAQGTYQSETPALPDEFAALLASLSPSMKYEGLRKEQYNAAIQIEQVIWAGGAVKAQVAVAEAEGKAAQAEWEAGMYAIREKVNQIFFGALMVQERIAEADLRIGELERHDRLIHAYEANGMANRNDLDLMRAELLSARQQRAELTAMLKAYRAMLAIMIGVEPDGDRILERPALPGNSPYSRTGTAPATGAAPVTATGTPPDTEGRVRSAISAGTAPESGSAGFQDAGRENNRPELLYFDARDRALDARRKSVDASVMPQIGAFVQGVYGYPSPDFFKSMSDSRPHPYYVAGVKLQWRFGGLYTRRNRLALIETERSLIASQRESFLYDTDLRRTQESIAIERMREVMRDDDEIMELRTAIRRRTEAGLANGTKSVSDLLSDIAAENLARQNRLVHEIELLKTIYELKFTDNN